MNNCSVLFCGFSCNEKSFYKILSYDKINYTQTYKFSKGIEKSLSKIFSSTYIISNIPCSSYPKNKVIYYNASNTSTPKKKFLSRPILNLPILKTILEFSTNLYYFFKLKPDLVVTHGLYFPYIFSTYIYSRIYKTKSIVYLTDHITTNDKNLALRVLRRTNKKLIIYFLRSFSGSITLSNKLAAYYMPNKPSISFIGFLPNIPPLKPNFHKSSEINFTYAGGLTSNYGVEDLIDIFKSLEESSCKLSICGRGELEEYCTKTSRSHSNINYLGFLNKEQIASLYSNTDIFINPRPLNKTLVDYSFPSKLVEYLSQNKPIITSKVPNIPQELNKCFIYIDTADKEEVKKLIYSITLKNINLYKEKYSKNKETYYNYFKSVDFMSFYKHILK